MFSVVPFESYRHYRAVKYLFQLFWKMLDKTDNWQKYTPIRWATNLNSKLAANPKVTWSRYQWTTGL